MFVLTDFNSAALACPGFRAGSFGAWGMWCYNRGEEDNGRRPSMTDEAPKRPTGDYDALYRSYLTLLKQVDQLSTLREVGLAINSTLELDEALPIIANVVQGALDVSKLTIFQLSKDHETARPVIAKFGRDLITPDRLEEEKRAVQGTPIGDALETRQVVVINTDDESDAYVPLMTKNAVLGILRLEDRRDGVPFSQEDAAFFHTLGSQIAVAINNAQLYAMAVTDGLTDLYVRRYFDLRMEEEFDQARRYNRCFALLMFDIDHFKKFNDTHGHQTGDMVLRQFAALLKENTRKSDICCRYGGEEMAIILPETALNEAALLGQKFCDAIRGHTFHGVGGNELSVTSSIGVAQYTEAMREPGDMVKACDDALYKAKELGRDRIQLAHL